MPLESTTTPNPLPQDIDHVQTSIFAADFRATTIGMLGLVALVAFESLAVVTAMPAAAQALHGLPLYALAFGSTLATSVIGTTLTGQWCDARGPAAPLWTALACFIAGLLIAGLASNMSMLIIGRMLQGVGGGGITVALYALVGRRYPTAIRPRLFAAFATSWALPALIGPALSGFVVESFHWRYVFLSVPLLALPAALLLQPALRAASTVSDGSIVSPQQILFATGAAIGICLLHIGGQLHGATAIATLIPAAMLTLLCALRLLPTGTLIAARGLPTVIALRGLVCAAFFGIEAFLPLLLTRERGLSPWLAGLALTAGAISWTFGSWFQGHARNGWSRHRFLRTGTSALCVGVVLATLAVFATVPVGIAVSGWAIAGLGMGMISSSLSMLTLALSTPERQASNSAALPLSEAVVVSTTMALGGSLFAMLLPISIESAYLANFAIAIIMALLGAAIVSRAGAHHFVVN